MPNYEDNEEDGDGEENMSVVEPASAQPLNSRTRADTIQVLKAFCRGGGEFEMPEIIEEEHGDSEEFDIDVQNAIARIATHKLVQKHSVDINEDEESEEEQVEWWRCKYAECKKWRKPPMNNNEECSDCEIDCDYCAQWAKGEPVCQCPASKIKRRKEAKKKERGKK